MDDRLPYFPFYADDFLMGVCDMTDEECGIYIKLLCISWSKNGANAQAKRVATANQELADLVLSRKFFQDAEGKWRNPKQEKIRSKQRARRESGSKGGSKREANSEAKKEAKAKRHIGSGSSSSLIRNKEVQEFDLPFDHEGFRSEWLDYVAMRSEIRKPLTPTAARKSLERLKAMGVVRATAALAHTTANQWQGIREPEGNQMAPNPEPKGKPKPIDGSAARFQLVKVHGVSEARNWSDAECLERLKQVSMKAP